MGDFRFVLYILLLLVGIFIGYKNFLSFKIVKKLDKLQFISLLALIFVMGIKIGGDKNVMNSIGSIGGKSFIFAFFTVVFSVLSIFLYKKIFYQKG